MTFGALQQIKPFHLTIAAISADTTQVGGWLSNGPPQQLSGNINVNILMKINSQFVIDCSTSCCLENMNFFEKHHKSSKGQRQEHRFKALENLFYRQARIC